MASSWEFTTSEGAEFDALAFAAGKGSFYVKNTDDADEIQHELLYVGAGMSMSKGPIPLTVGGSFSTPDMPSEGAGPIALAPDRITLTTSDFSGLGFILSGTLQPMQEAKDWNNWTIVLWGWPFVRAVGRIRSKVATLPGGGFTAMPVIFTVDP